MAQAGEDRTGIGEGGRVRQARGAPHRGRVEDVGALEVVEIEPGVEQGHTAEELGAELNSVSVADDDLLAVRESGLEFVVLVLGRTGGDEVETLVAGIVRIGDHDCFSMTAMSADGAPFFSRGTATNAPNNIRVARPMAATLVMVLAPIDCKNFIFPLPRNSFSALVQGSEKEQVRLLYHLRTVVQAQNRYL